MGAPPSEAQQVAFLLALGQPLVGERVPEQVRVGVARTRGLRPVSQ